MTELYRHFGTEGDLLYVGISLSTVARLSQHIGDSEWAEQIATITIERFPSRQAALGAERRAIQVERPKYNKVHAMNIRLENIQLGECEEGWIPTKYAASEIGVSSELMTRWINKGSHNLPETFHPPGTRTRWFRKKDWEEYKRELVAA